MKGKSRMECMVKCSLVILHVFQGCLEFQTQVLRVRSSSCAMPLYTLDMKAKLSLLVHHDCNLRLYIMHRLMVKKLSQYLVGCWNIMIHCASAHVVYFKLGVLVFFCFLICFSTKQFKQTHSTWQKKTYFVFLMVQMLLQFMHSLRFYPVKLDSSGKRKNMKLLINT